jgi:hypothetical protein
MKVIIKNLVISFLLINLGLTIFGLTLADPGGLAGEANSLTSSQSQTTAFAVPLTDLQGIGEKTGLPSFYFQGGQHPEAPVDFEFKGVGTIGSTAYYLMDFFKYLMSSVAIVMIIVIAIKLIFAGSNEETTTKAKKGLALAVAGLIVIQLADVAVKKVLFGEHGEVLEDKSTAELFAKEGIEEARGIVGFIQVALGAVAVLVIIINGIKIMVTGSEEEARKKGLKNIGFAAGGLVLVMLSEFIVRVFVFPEFGEELPQVEAGKQLFAMITNFIAGFIAVIAFVMFLVAGYTYVVGGAAENAQEKVKKLILGAVLGLVIALGAFALTNTLITFEEDNEYIPPAEEDILEEL